MKKILLFFFIFFLLDIVYANTILPIDIRNCSVDDLILYMDKGIISSEELTNAYLDRINEYNDTYKAIITINSNVINDAKEMDALRNKGEIKGRLHGIPIIVKDNIDVYGLPTTGGSKALSDNMPKSNSPVVQRLIDEGAIIIGKANMSEFAFSASSSKSSYGIVSNAYKVGYTSYGSSGGSAVSVALDFAPIALGTDTNSSVRLPAAASGLVGIRPSFGKLSNQGVIAYDINRDTVGVLTKSVKDNALVMEILSDEKYDLNIKEKVKIGVPLSFYKGNDKSSIKANKVTYEPIIKLIEDNIKKLEEQNIEVIYLEDFYTNKEQSLNSKSIAGFTMCKAFNEYIKDTDGTIRSFSQLNNSKGKITNLSGYNRLCNYSESSINKVHNLQDQLRIYIDDVYNKYDLDYIMYPSTKNELFKNGQNNLLNVSSTISSTIGFPSITIPLGYIDDLPYGIEFMARMNEEEQLYQISYLFESINNQINKIDSSAPRLYEVDDEVSLLVNNFLEKADIKEYNEWISEVKEYFSSYQKNDERLNDAKLLNEKMNNIVLDKKDNLVKTIFNNKYIYIICLVIISLITLIAKYKTIK